MGVTIFEKELGAPAKLMYLLLSAIADDEGNVVVSKEELKKLAGYKCKRSIRTGIMELEENGLIEIERNNINGYDTANKYTLIKSA